MNEYIGTQAAQTSEDELKHWKYISKKRVNGKWVYFYGDSSVEVKKPIKRDKAALGVATKSVRVDAPKSGLGTAKGGISNFKSSGLSSVKGIGTRTGVSGLAPGVITRLYKKSVRDITSSAAVDRGKSYISKTAKKTKKTHSIRIL